MLTYCRQTFGSSFAQLIEDLTKTRKACIQLAALAIILSAMLLPCSTHAQTGEYSPVGRIPGPPVDFTWPAHPEAVAYDIHIYDTNWNHIFLNIPRVPTNSIHLPNLNLPPGEYYWVIGWAFQINVGAHLGDYPTQEFIILLPGDANYDGCVDAQDFNILREHLFTEHYGTRYGDFNLDGVIDLTDFNIWNENSWSCLDIEDTTGTSVPQSPAAASVGSANPTVTPTPSYTPTPQPT